MLHRNGMKLFIYNLFIYVSAIYAFLWLHPFFTWNNSIIMYAGILYFLIFLVWIFIEDIKINIVHIFITMCALTLIILFSFKNENIIRNILLYSISLIPLTLVNKEVCRKIYDNFIKVISISLLPAVVIAILLFMGIELNWSELLSTSWTKPYYRNYFNLSIYTAYGGVSQQYFFPWGGSIDRICGMFDEPGVVGTVSGLILVSRNFSMNRIYEKIILLAGILSFSFAFYLIVVGFLLIKKPRIGITIVACLIILYQIVPQDSYVYSKILYRFEITDKGLIGNNRTNEGFDRLYSDFIQNDNVWWGIKEKEFLNRAQYYGSEALSWKTFVVINGAVLFILHTLYFIGYGAMLRDRRVWMFCFVYFFSIYQRPYDFSLGYWLIFFGGVITFVNMYISDDNN
ncbi:transcriptional regulator [Bacillus albus]|uniref:transcriptional regulator n=1 Tax=Bacillus albus TaxID=2026189 RepID=UPI00234B573C|nr:transcriptional regulator [Bacillus albus]MDC6158985.1 transcriptional regulator [Bacillus albus]MDD8008462.1 transcriptional regulator [Bacillus albus]